MQLQVAYLLTIAVALIGLLGLLEYSWRRRRDPGWRRMAWLTFQAAGWTFLVAAMALATPAAARALLSVKYLFIGTTASATLLFTGWVTGRWQQVSRRQLAALLAVAVIGHLVSWRDGAGVIQSVTFDRAYDLTYISAVHFGPVYWAETTFNYAQVLVGLWFIVTFMRRGGPVARRQGGVLILAIVAPLTANVLLITGIAPRQFDPMPLGLAIAVFAYWWGAFRHQLVELLPVARHVLVDAMQDGMLVIDAKERVVDVNRHLATTLGTTPELLVGRTLGRDVLGESRVEAELLRVLRAGYANGAGTGLVSLVVGGRDFELQVLDTGPTRARVCMLRDVTERRRWEREQERLITELQGALGQVKTLSGLLPICAGCKKIRDGDGDWHQLEVYIRDRTDADFSHGLCPACVQALYPGEA